MKAKSVNKEKPARPDVSFWFPPSDVTTPPSSRMPWDARSWARERTPQSARGGDGGPDVCGHKQISQMLRNIYDRQRAGALRATADGITGNPVLRQSRSLLPICSLQVLQEPSSSMVLSDRMVFSYRRARREWERFQDRVNMMPVSLKAGMSIW